MNDTFLTLNDEHKIPQLGLGCWKLPDNDDTVELVKQAIELGYRHFDTAMIYRNEESVGKGIAASGVPREELYITTKLWADESSDAVAAARRSLERLGLDYVDLYLMHWPPEGRETEVWTQLEAVAEAGLARSIGLSNYSQPQIEDILKVCTVKPAVNQIEVSPFVNPHELTAYCQEQGIAVEAYSPLARGNNHDNKVLQQIAQDADKTAAQVLIKWGLQHGYIEIPKTASPERLSENMDVFGWELSADAMKQLDELD